MPAGTILAIDQGTTNTKALLVDLDGMIVARASRAMTLTHPRPGWAEQSAADIWASVRQVIADIVAQRPDTTPAALAISNQRETIVLWDAETGEPVGPAISWQCRRSSERCAALRMAGHGPLVFERTGLALDPLFPAAKLAWLLDRDASVRARAEAGMLRAGTIDSWLLWNLTDGTEHATDHSNASRTQLFDLRSLAWDPELAALFDVPLALLPAVLPSNSRFGKVAGGRTALSADIPIHAMMGDSHAALFGHRVTRPGVAKVTIGTGSSIMALTEDFVTSTNGLSSTIAWSTGNRIRYALEGNITVSGQAAAFAAQLLGTDDEEALSSLAQTVEDAGGVVFVPALAGLGAPHWRDRARGQITGMTLATTPAHLARAVFDAIALQIVDVCQAMEADIGGTLTSVSVDGGATRNDFLLQLLADLLGRTVTRKAHAELSALGVAMMAAQALGFAANARSADSDSIFQPTIDAARCQDIHRAWHAAVRLAIQACQE
jgi:glycerol kinase